MVIDAHIHLFSEDVSHNRQRYCSDPGFRLLYENPRARIAHEDDLDRYLDEAGIDGAFILGFPWEHEAFADSQNTCFAELTRRSSRRCIAFGSVPVTCGDIPGWVGRLREQGISGIGEIAFYGRGPAGHHAYLDAVLDAAASRQMPVCIHVSEPVGHRYPGKDDAGFDALIGVIANHPGASVILAHWGGGLLFYEQMPEVAAALASCWYDTAATPYLYTATIYDIGVRLVGAERILFGSDFPLLRMVRYREAIETSGLTREQRDAIMGGSALKLMKRISG